MNADANIEEVYERIQAIEDPAEQTRAVAMLDPEIRMQYRKLAGERGTLQPKQPRRKAAQQERERKAELKAKRDHALPGFEQKLNARLRDITDKCDEDLATLKQRLVMDKLNLDREYAKAVKATKRTAQDERDGLTQRSWKRFNDRYPTE